MNRSGTFVSGLAIGASLMYILDPDRGTRRRAMVRDKAVRAMHTSQDFLGKASRDLRHRTSGIVAKARHRFRHLTAPDDVLVERVRSKMGRYVSHPHAIEVTADDGFVTLRGPILESEAGPLIRAIESLPGVKVVDSQLERHTYAENIPALQGGVTPAGEPAEWQQRNWTPGLQLLTGVAGGALLLYGARALRSHRNGHDTGHHHEPHGPLAIEEVKAGLVESSQP